MMWKEPYFTPHYYCGKDPNFGHLTEGSVQLLRKHIWWGGQNLIIECSLNELSNKDTKMCLNSLFDNIWQKNCQTSLEIIMLNSNFWGRQCSKHTKWQVWKTEYKNLSFLYDLRENFFYWIGLEFDQIFDLFDVSGSLD